MKRRFFAVVQLLIALAVSIFASVTMPGIISTQATTQVTSIKRTLLSEAHQASIANPLACEISPQAFGVQVTHASWPNHDLSTVEIMLDRVAEGGLTHVRFHFDWNQAQTERGVWHSWYLDRVSTVLGMLQARHIEPIVVLSGVAEWARINSTEVAPYPDRIWAIPPDDPAYYAEAAEYLAEFYSGQIRTWEIWNEPNMPEFWNAPTGPDPARYTAMLRASYDAIKRVDPDITVLGGSLAGIDESFLHHMYDAGADGHFDALSLHPYCDPNPPECAEPGQVGCDGTDVTRWSFARIPRMEDIMALHNEPDKPIWITEMGWTTYRGTDDVTRADYYNRALDMMRDWPYVKVFIAYYLTADGETEEGFELWSGDTPSETWRAYTSRAAVVAPFSDVPPTSNFYPYVMCLSCRSVLAGYGDGTFRPGVAITRGQLAKIIAGAAGFNEPVSGQIYEDVPPTNAFYEHIGRMAERGIIGGYPCGGSGEPCGAGNKPYFRPNVSATRGQISKIVSQAKGYTDPVSGQTFEDVSPTNSFYLYIKRLASRGIMGGYQCGSAGEPCSPQNRPYFRWGNNATRGQTSKIVSNAFFPNCHTSDKP